jgi:preprotein translocase subunit SecA
MRRGIGLRGYSQQDPLNEFKKEAFGLYEELTGFIRHNVANAILRVQVTQQPAPPPPGPFVMSGPGQTAGQAPGANGNGNGRGNGGRPVDGAPSPARQPGAAILAGGAATGTAASRIMGRSGNGAAGAAAAGAAAGSLSSAQARPGYTPSGAKIGRNDACWCGSGLKYKKCHGR